MAYPEHLRAFVQLGALFNEFCDSDTIEKNPWLQKLEAAVIQAEQENKWYTQENLRFAMQAWASLLKEDALTSWLAPYSTQAAKTPKRVALVMAGNIPMVGFHDFLSVLLSGHIVVGKLSSNDKVLLPFIREFLIAQAPEFEEKITFTEERLGDFEAAIATGSTNTGRYFDYYFGKYPNIIRKNRNSVAVLTGNETPAQLEALGEDIFRYFGLGCRSVSKLFVPEGYNFDAFYQAQFHWKIVLEHHKYVNNYDYNKAVYLMSENAILDNGFLILKEDPQYASPIATLFYEYYSSGSDLKERLQQDAEAIQCVVADGFIENEIAFGETQSPSLTDYADGVNTLAFLAQL